MPQVHPSAIISDQAQIADDVIVGPFSIIDAGVSIGAGCRIGPRAWITGNTQMGEGNKIGCGAIIGDNPQDASFDTAIQSNVILGNNNRIGDYVTIHRSTAQDGSTSIGDNNFLMIGVHVAHDCQMGHRNNLANNVLLGGHVHIGNNTFLGGGGAFHQFLHIGDYSLSQGNASISRDVPPFCLVHGHNQLLGLNVIGLRRGGFAPAERSDIKRAYNLLFRSGGNLSEALAVAETQEWSKGALILIEAARKPSRKGLMTQ